MQGLNEDLQAFFHNTWLHGLVAEEFLKDLYGGHTEVPIAKWDEEVIFKAWEYGQPAVDLFLFEILLKAGVKDLDMCSF